MAKNNQESNTETVVAEAPAAGGRGAITLGNGEKRADYIRRRYSEGASRSEITKEINTPELYTGAEGKKWPYQIVFQATKDKSGGAQPQTEAGASSGQVAENA